MDEFMTILSRYPNGTYMTIVWEDVILTLGGLLETIYQTNNGLVPNTPSYEEYYAAVFRIKDILENKSANNYTTNTVMELSARVMPDRITLQDGTVIWQKQKL